MQHGLHASITAARCSKVSRCQAARASKAHACLAICCSNRTPRAKPKCWPRTRTEDLPSWRAPTDADVCSYGPQVWTQIGPIRSEEHTSELQSRGHLVCRLLLEKKNMT